MLVIALIMLAAGVLGANFAIRGSSRLAAEVRNDCISPDSEVLIRQYRRVFYRFTDYQNHQRYHTDSELYADIAARYVPKPGDADRRTGDVFCFKSGPCRVILIVVPILALAIAAIIITASPRYTVMQQKIVSSITARRNDH